MTHYDDRIQNLLENLDVLLAKRNFVAYYKTKDMIWAARSAKKNWPAASCTACEHGCCQRTWHHVGDCCIHCGMDERHGTGPSLVAEAVAEAERIFSGIATTDNRIPDGYVQVSAHGDSATFATDLDAVRAVAGYTSQPYFMYSGALRAFSEPNVSEAPEHWLDCDRIIYIVPLTAAHILETAISRAPSLPRLPPSSPSEDKKVLAAVEQAMGAVRKAHENYAELTDAEKRDAAYGLTRYLSSLATSAYYARSHFTIEIGKLEDRAFENWRGAPPKVCYSCGSANTTNDDDPDTRCCMECGTEYAIRPKLQVK